MLFCIVLSCPTKENLRRSVLIILLPALLFFIIVYSSVTAKAFGGLSKLLSFSFILVFGCIFHQCNKLTTKEINNGSFFKHVRAFAVVGIVLWGLWIVLQIQNDSNYLSHDGLYVTWLLFKVILIILLYQLVHVVEESSRDIARKKLLNELKNTLSESSAVQSILYNFPAFLLLTDKDGNIVFLNKIAQSKLGMSTITRMDFHSVFMDSIEEAVSFERVTFKDQNNSLHMFAVRTEKIFDDEKNNECLLWILRTINFEFEIFCLN